MKLVWKNTPENAGRVGKEVMVDDAVLLDPEDQVPAVITKIEKPHKPSSTGRVVVRLAGTIGGEASYFPSVIGAEWVDREDQPKEEVVDPTLIMVSVVLRNSAGGELKDDTFTVTEDEIADGGITRGVEEFLDGEILSVGDTITITDFD